MNWIKSNPFVSALAGITVFICGILYFFASKGGSKYEAAKESFDIAYNKVSSFERIPLYPKATTRDAKKKALADYRESIEDLRGQFAKYRVDEIEDIDSQKFVGRLKAANKEVSEALSSAGCEVPEGFFMGFESYNASQSKLEKFGYAYLDYELEAFKHALLNLAEARPSELIKVHREKILEENGGKPPIGPDEVVRKFGFEVTFKGSEASARNFISALGDTDPYYYVVRCIKIENERDTPPRVADAKFEQPKAARKEAEELNPFGAGFFFPEEEEPAATEDEAPAVEAPAEGAPVVEEAPAVAADSSKILAQVLGGEEVIVFIRFDLAMFLPIKELPKP